MIHIEKKIDDLTFQKWVFTFLDNKLYLDNYTLFQKENKKSKKYKTLKEYHRLSDKLTNISESDVPFTEELKQEVLNQFMSKIKVCKWSER